MNDAFNAFVTSANVTGHRLENPRKIVRDPLIQVSSRVAIHALTHGSTGDNLLMPSPKELDKALTLLADRARRMAETFGLKVPGVAPKPEKTHGSATGPRRATKA